MSEHFLGTHVVDGVWQVLGTPMQSSPAAVLHVPQLLIVPPQPSPWGPHVEPRSAHDLGLHGEMVDPSPVEPSPKVKPESSPGMPASPSLPPSASLFPLPPQAATMKATTRESLRTEIFKRMGNLVAKDGPPAPIRERSVGTNPWDAFGRGREPRARSGEFPRWSAQ
jgi:hypothetical protein